MSETEELTTAIPTLYQRIGVVKASITSLNTHLIELEIKVHELSTLSHTQKLSAKFKSHHYSIIDIILDDDHIDETMTNKQEKYDY